MLAAGAGYTSCVVFVSRYEEHQGLSPLYPAVCLRSCCACWLTLSCLCYGAVTLWDGILAESRAKRGNIVVVLVVRGPLLVRGYSG